MKIKKYSMFLLLVLLFFASPIWAQTEIVGTKGKLILLDQIMGGTITCISGNGKYAGGYFSEKAGFVYDIEKDTTYILDMFVAGVSDNMDAAGHYELSTEWKEPRVWRKGVMKTLPLFAPENASSYVKSITMYGMSSDGNTIVGMGYEIISGHNGKPYLGVMWKGDTIYKALRSHFPLPTDEAWLGYGGRPTGVSGDGNTTFGFSIAYSGGPRSPVYWQGDTSYSLAIEDLISGEASGSNYDGSVIVGQLESLGRVWEKGKEPITIPTVPGWRQTAAAGISEKGLVIGYMTGLEFGDRAPFIWSKENGTLSINEFLFEFYGIEVGDKNLFTAYGMSRDGRVMTGFIFTNGARCSYLIVVDETPLNTRPLSLLTKQVKDEMNVNLSWGVPYKIEKSVIGYNVYRDTVLLTKTPITTLKYRDETATKGIHTYTVTAIYADGESPKSEESKVQIVEPGGCYSVKYIRADLEYNRNLQIRWGQPSSEIIELNNAPRTSMTPQTIESQPTPSPEQNSLFAVIEGTNEMPADIVMSTPTQNKASESRGELDLVYLKNLAGYEKVVVAKIGDYYYSDNWNIAGITKYDEQWKPIGNIKIEGLPAVRGFATDGTSIYAIAGTKFIYEIDFEYNTIINTIPIPEIARHIAYIPELDNGNGGFEIGNYNTSIFIKKDGTKISDGFIGLVDAAGAAYHKGKVYMTQNTGKSKAEIHEFDVVTKQATGFVFDFAKMPEIQDVIAKYGGYTGSITLITLENGTVCLAPVMQVTYAENIVVLLELESMPGLTGFNLYKNNVKVNGETPMKERHFTETLLTPGTYVYEVSSVFGSKCESEKSYAQTVTIDSILGCDPITNLRAFEQNKNVALSFDMPIKNAQSQLLGFNVYCDNRLLNDELLIYLRYQDSAPALGQHIYRVESFYSNSCIASDSIVIEVTHQGSCSAPEYLVFTPTLKDPVNKKFDVEAKWNAPFFEEPLALRWGNGSSARAVGLQEGKTLAVASGWDSTQLGIYRDYSIIGIELILRDETKDVRPIVFINEKLVYEESLGRTPVNEYFNSYFDYPIPIGDAYEVVVGYVAEYENGKSPFSLDNGPLKVGYGDLFTTDFENWGTWGCAGRDLGLSGNWTIAAILAKTHTLSKSTAYTGEWENKGQSIVKVDMATMEVIKQEVVESIYAPSETLSLTGFNIYRDNVKLNAEPLKELSYLDTNLSENTYIYKVSSLWNTCDEIFAAAKNVKISATAIDEDNTSNTTLNIYPNPVQDILHIQGVYKGVEIFDVFGRKVLFLNQGAQTIDCRGLAKGIYTLRFLGTDGRMETKKIVKE